MSNPAFEYLAFDKENFETWVDETGQTVLSDVQWEKVKDELDGRAENFMDEMIYMVVQDFREGHYDD
jgi:trimethylamine:corrinoid methyltransferase-like protein